MVSLSKELIVNGWLLFAHPVFLNQYKKLIHEVEGLASKDPEHFQAKKPTKILAAIQKLILQDIPADPTLEKFRQGGTLGEAHKHWFRAKFFQQYRLFFRFHKESKIIVYAWVNDESSKRAYDSQTDAYAVFRKMLKKGRPPSDWADLLKEACAISD